MKGSVGIIMISTLLVIIGALILGWQGLTTNNIMDAIGTALGPNQWVKRVFYIIIGIAGLILAWQLITSVMAMSHEKSA
jgi:uncharacterized membrane protein YuzA (DUF378 family)